MQSLTEVPEANALDRVLEAIRIIGPDAFSLAGRVTHIPAQPDLAQQASALIAALQNTLYEQAYSRTFRGAPRTIADERPDRALQRALARANTSRSRWDPGWTIEAAPGAETFVVRKNGAALLVRPGDFALNDPYAWPPRNGDRVSIRVRRGARRLQSAFYFAFGETPADLGADFNLVRLYWNVQLAGAAVLVRALTGALNRFRVPFRLKCLTIPAHYERVDSAVLFIQQRFFPLTAQLIRSLWPDLAAHLAPEVPLCTLPLAPGLAVAENPPDGGSFGRSRCRLLAQGLWDAHVQCVESPAEQLECIARRFSAAGLDLEQPHLNAQSSATYALPAAPTAGAAAASNSEQSVWLDAAAALGARLCRDAIWHAGQCAWFGDYYERVHGEAVRVHRSLGANLYAGSAGIALFLAELHRATGEPVCAATSSAAARHALAGSTVPDAGQHIGFYTGLTGVAHALVRVGELLGQEEISERGLRLVKGLPGVNRNPNETDVLSGWAGAVPALLELCARYPDPELSALALQLGEQVITLAREQPESSSAPTLLTGFSHGAAGYAWCACELYARTADDRFKTAAAQLLDFEQRYYDEAEGNWQDLRDGWPAGADGPRYALAWCNGAPGIALSRVRAFHALGERRYLREAEQAIALTAHAVAEGVRSARGADFSLCHGLSGCADILSLTDLMLHGNQHSALVQELAATGIKRYHAHCTWPSGVRAGDNPGLLLGLAGTGYFYLRLANPLGIPSLLLPARPFGWSRSHS